MIVFVCVDCEFYVYFGVFVEGVEYEVWVENFYVIDGLNVVSCDNIWFLFVYNYVFGVFVFYMDGDFFDVEYDVGDIFVYVWNGGEFVQNFVDLDCGYCCFLKGRQQDLVQSIV